MGVHHHYLPSLKDILLLLCIYSFHSTPLHQAVHVTPESASGKILSSRNECILPFAKAVLLPLLGAYSITNDDLPDLFLGM